MKKIPTNEEVKTAFMDIMDGQVWQDIQKITGLSKERCQEIYDIYRRLEE